MGTRHYESYLFTNQKWMTSFRKFSSCKLCLSSSSVFVANPAFVHITFKGWAWKCTEIWVFEWNWIKLQTLPSLSVNLSFHTFLHWQSSCPWATKLSEWYKIHNNNPSLSTFWGFSLYINSTVHQLKDLKYDYETCSFHKMLTAEQFLVEPTRKLIITPTVSVLPAMCFLLFLSA